MDKIWDRIFFEVGGMSLAVVAGLEKKWTRRTDKKSNAKNSL